MRGLAGLGVALAMLCASGGMAVAQNGDSQLGNPVMVPPAPAITPSPSIQSMPLPPDAQVSPPDQVLPPPPGLVQTPMPPANADNGAPPDGGAAALATTPPAPSQSWVPGQTAGIGLLDKVDGSTSEVSIPVGGQSNSGDLRISILACVARPADEIPDAAVFVSIQTSGNPSGPPLYRGWMVRSTPGNAVVGDASATLRVVSCS